MTGTITLNSPFDMAAFNFDDFNDGHATTETSTEFDIVTAHHSYTVTGTGFGDYQSDGLPINGQITGFTIDDALTATGVSTDVPNFVDEGWQIMHGLTVNGSSGNDVLVSYGGIAYGHDGDDTLDAMYYSTVLDGGKGNDTFNGYIPEESTGAYSDTAVTYQDATSGVKVYLSLSGAHDVGGGMGSDTFDNIQNVTGSAFADHLIGNANANVLDGGGGIDTLGGGQGDDTLIAESTSDALNGGKGTDTVEFNTGAAIVYDAHALVSVETVVGTPFDDTITGADYAQTLEGGDGNDTLTGGAHNDVLMGGTGDDVLNGGGGYANMASYANATSGVTVDLSVSGPQAVGADQGTDTLGDIQGLIGSQYKDKLSGDNHANTLDGGYGNDTISGYAGNDKIEGGDGADTMTGGPGADTFVYDAPAEGANELVSPASTPDLITDFDASEDRFQMTLHVGHVLPSAVNFITTGQLDSGANYHQEFDALLQTIGTSYQVALVTPDSGTLAGHHYLVVNLDLQADNIAYDVVIELGPASNLAGFGTQDFI